MKFFRAVVRTVATTAAAMFKRLVANQPLSDYERVAFNALYETGSVYRKGVRL